MRRRRLIAVVGALALSAAGVAGWLSRDHLAPEEQRLIGTWRHSAGPTASTATWIFRPDRSSEIWQIAPDPSAARVDGDFMVSGRWRIDGGEVVVDDGAVSLPRAVRSICRLLGTDAGWECRTKLTFRSDDEFVSGDHTPLVWTRDPAD